MIVESGPNSQSVIREHEYSKDSKNPRLLPKQVSQNEKKKDVPTSTGYGRSVLFQHLNAQKPNFGTFPSAISEGISSPDGSQPHTPPSVTSGTHTIQYEELKQQVEKLQSELYRYKQHEAQERITQHTMEEIVGLASDGDHLLMNSASNRVQQSMCDARPFQPSSQPFGPFAGQSDAWSSGPGGTTNLGRDISKATMWPVQPSTFATTVPTSSATIPISTLYQGTYSCSSTPAPVPTSPPHPSLFITSSLADNQISGHDADSLSSVSMASGACSGWPPSSAASFFTPSASQTQGDIILPSVASFDPFSPKGLHRVSHDTRVPFVGPASTLRGSQSSTPASIAGPAVANSAGSTWSNRTPSGNSTNDNFSAPHEPLNYRRLLEKDALCNWDYVVDKIVGNNDQQASIFLQQKLKIGSSAQKHEIVEAILKQCYPLMINRFGNFLVQRCFEHGTSQQIVNIAYNIRTHTVGLSMDPFGCHVVQKALDCVPEEFKACFVKELMRRIPETVIHRYACHVWQKLFELHWIDTPPQIMKHVNEALRGMWHEVALGETGSLVVQNIFENCVEEDKRPCIDEVLTNIDVIARGQFGNWCIQHICENGLPADKGRAVEQVIHFATEYSVDQYASKVIEKCLKVGGQEFFDRYLTRVCEARPDRPRMPLIDIAGDQFGNYLIQYILANASPQHRELVATHVRKHMVSLRGSKYGSRVAMLCSNPSTVTRPGPPSSSYAGRYNGRGYRANHYP